MTAPNVASRSPQDRPRRPRTPQRAPQETPRGGQDPLFFILGYVFAVLSRWLNVFNGFSINLRTRVCDPKSSKTSVPWGLAHETVRERCKKTPKSRSQVGVAGKNGPLLPQIRGFTTVCRIPQNRRICKNHCFQDSFNVLNSQQSILFSFLSSQMRPKRPQDRSKSAQVRPKSFEIVERCRKKSRKQTLEPQVRNPRTKQAARRSTRRKIRRPRVRSSPGDRAASNGRQQEATRDNNDEGEREATEKPSKP